MICIGIDPGKHTGVAIARNGKLEAVFETDFWGVIEFIENNKDAQVVVEIPGTKHVWHNDAKAKEAIQRTGVNVGSALREAELIVNYLERYHCNFLTQKPHGKIKKSEDFKRITGWTGRTNQHMRDAAMLIYGLKETGNK